MTIARLAPGLGAAAPLLACGSPPEVATPPAAATAEVGFVELAADTYTLDDATLTSPPARLLYDYQPATRDDGTAPLLLVTGGGPGAMEAANLGAYAASPADLDAAIAALSKVPSYRPDVGPWAELGLRVREHLGRRPDSGELRGLPLRSIGIPTWFYGHEPPNVFGQGIAKYFSNALREDGLLARCTAGTVVLPGAAGTVQEIFQGVTRLYYGRLADPTGTLPPLVLVGRSHWQRLVPTWPLVTALAGNRPMAEVVHLVDTIEEAAAILLP